jgi:hemerythrin superfamily protein
MDAIDLLIADHNRVRGIFEQFQEAKENDDTAEMSELAEKIFFELQVHTEIEEKVFYPGVRGLEEEISEEVAEGLEEHHVVDVLMEEAKGLEPGDERWVAKLIVIIESVEHHAAEEEEEMFPEVRKVTDEAKRNEWGERMEQLKAQHGAPTPADAEKLTTEELKKLASEQHIPNRSKMTRDDLVATVDAR